MKKIILYVSNLVFALVLSTSVFAQESINQEVPAPKQHNVFNSKDAVSTLHALRIAADDKVILDGKLDEPLWRRASIATGFIQRAPQDGSPASEKTEVRLIYTDDVIYIGAKVFDSAVDSVAATLFRKDGDAYSDWFYVGIDSYNDNRTSFSFGVNPRGVRKDLLIYNNDREDTKWDAVWEASTGMQDDGWIVEMKIPLSQLRFNGKKINQQWGINFQREIARKGEVAFWSPTPQNSAGLVSNFGELKGIKNLPQPKRLEIKPYFSGKLTRAPKEVANPFYNRNDLFGSVGADVKYGITSDLTLTATINPDFGQVEADPAVINLSANEVYNPEQRSFFLEGSDIFEFGNVRAFSRIGNPYVFYSRRIGRRPQGRLSQAGLNPSHVDRPEFTTIASAAKLSGKTKNGLSVGVLNAFTLGESADYQLDSQTGSMRIEPPTNYFVGRFKKDLNGDDAMIGAYGSAVNRVMGTGYLKDQLHESAYIAGMDFEQSWKDREWILSGTFSASSVSGRSESLQLTQQSSLRYYDRPDADYLSVDPTKTNLQGYAGSLAFGRFAGEHWLASASYSVVSPGYEVNDLGYGNRTDYQGAAYFLRYQENNPTGMFRSYNIAAVKYHLWNFGGDQIEDGYNLLGGAEFKNQWSLNLASGLDRKRLDDRLLRGGPLALTPLSYFGSAVLSTNDANKLSFEFGHLRGGDSEGGFERDLFVNMVYRPTSYIQVELKPNYNIQKTTTQYVDAISDPSAVDTYGKRYVFADLDQTTLSTSLRLDWTFSPIMSLQTYVRPYITSGNFENYKEFQTPRELDFEVYGEDTGSITKTANGYQVDPDGAGPANAFSIAEQDFNFRSVQTNAVFRWEYMPGSTLYVVWQQDRSAFANTGDFKLSRDMDGLLNAKPTNVFLVKLSYWFSR